MPMIANAVSPATVHKAGTIQGSKLGRGQPATAARLEELEGTVMVAFAIEMMAAV